MKYLFLLLLVYTSPLNSLLAQGPIVKYLRRKQWKEHWTGKSLCSKAFHMQFPLLGEMRWKAPGKTPRMERNQEMYQLFSQRHAITARSFYDVDRRIYCAATTPE